MIISYPIASEMGQRMIKKYTVKNREIDKLEAITKRKMPRLHFIKLYYTQGGYVLLPHGQYNAQLSIQKQLSDPIQYSFIPTIEQQLIFDDISMWDIKTGLIEMKTGRGKSMIIMGLVSMLNTPTLIAVHNTGTLQDMKTKIKEFTGYDAGIYYSKKKDIKEITITTHASFSQKPEVFAGKFGMVIIDECDYNFTDKMLRAICISDADALFGLTGTPQTQGLSSDDMELVFGKRLKVDGQDNNGYNIIPKIERIIYKTNRFFSFKNWHELKQQMIECGTRIGWQLEKIQEYIRNGKTKFGLLLVERKEQECYMFYDKLQKLGINSVIINGDTKAEDDEKNVEALYKQGGGIIVGTVGKVGRGKDIPFLDTIFLFFPNKFESSTVQAVGRGLRKFDGKEQCILVDRVDAPILNKQASERKSTYIKEYGEDVEIDDEVILDFVEEKITIL